MKKNIFSSSLSHQWVEFFVNLLADRKAVYSQLVGDVNQSSIFLLALDTNK